jgi:hypothetical protein
MSFSALARFVCDKKNEDYLTIYCLSFFFSNASTVSQKLLMCNYGNYIMLISE